MVVQKNQILTREQSDSCLTTTPSAEAAATPPKQGGELQKRNGDAILNSELEQKTQRLQEMLGRENLACVLLNTQHNFSWLTGGRSNGIDLSRENGAGWLLVTRSGKRYTIANNIEMSRLLSEEVSRAEFEPIEITWQSEKDPYAVINAVGSVAGDGDIGCDIGFPETRWIEPSIATCRFELTPDEIERFKDLGRDSGTAFESVVPRLSPGQSAHGIFSVVTLVAGDDRIANFRHPIPTDNGWSETVMIVICARRHGLIASSSRIICAGDVPSDLQRRTESCAAVNAALYAGTVPGATGSELYDIAARAYEAQGFAGEINKHHQGGACGYRTRDWVAHPDSIDIAHPNQGFAWNPSITGTKTEETAILVDGNLEIITSTSSFPTISTVIDGREYLSPGILSLTKGATA